ncbi:hypothetical protein RF11_15863 [Thelohanellus kitauei]|uniref:Uncharacterized protein n=1 Tax=Thelohanellus kitauei TaxID=669202 RepID=A0A0C2JLN5_THEKT|nr:hypothetical protein RF11_15863 [Thelohanellus kitauei]
MTYICHTANTDETLSASSFEAPSPELTESEECGNEFVPSRDSHEWELITSRKRFMDSLLEISDNLLCEFSFCSSSLWGVFVVEHFILVEICYSFVVARSRTVCDFIVEPRTPSGALYWGNSIVDDNSAVSGAPGQVLYVLSLVSKKPDIALAFLG